MPDNSFRPCIAITSGEPAGVGPDILAKLNPGQFSARLVIVGDSELIASRSHLPLKPYEQNRKDHDGSFFEILHLPLKKTCVPGTLDADNAYYVLQTLDRACKGCLDNEFDAMVTAPIQKDIINQAGIHFTGHTEYLAELCGAEKPVMLLIAENLRVALVTTHLPLRKVADAINTDLIVTIARIIDRDLRERFDLQKPHIKICGLNPHAGENGYLGSEETDIIEPAIQILEQDGLKVSGPYPADTVFTPRGLEDADVVLAMYHDQGLPVLKHAGFHRAINTTLGLPIIRTSVDHGTALELAGTRQADPGSLFAAINSAISQATLRKHP
jgi:4-hydroxythreonine-4-phosphate dehydrogenase